MAKLKVTDFIYRRNMLYDKLIISLQFFRSLCFLFKRELSIVSLRNVRMGMTTENGANLVIHYLLIQIF